MNLNQKTISALTIAALLTFGGSPVHAHDQVAKINSANQALVDGKVDEALAQYDAVAQTMPASPLLAYNRGVALYRKGQVDQARQSFSTALDTDDPELAAQAGFNLGNCHYAAAVQQSETDRAVAIDSLQTAIAHYRSALQSNSADTDARSNIELAQQLIKKLKKEQQQEQQQQDQQQENQESQNQDSSQSDQDESDQSDSQEGESGEKDPGESRSEESKSDEKQPKESSSEQDDTQQAKTHESKSGEQSDEKNQSEENSTDSKSDDPEDVSTEQQNATGSDNKEQNQQPEQEPSAPNQPEEPKGDQQPQPGDQDNPAEQKAGQQNQAGSDAQKDQSDEAQHAPGYGYSQTGEHDAIDKEEAMKMLQAIRDRDLSRRMQKLNEKRRQHRPVDRDW